MPAPPVTRTGVEIMRAIEELERDLGSQVVTWYGNDYVCVPKSSVEDLTLSTGGIQPGIDQVIFLSLSRFGDNSPQPEQPIIFNNRRFWIKNVTRSSDGVYIRLDCQLPEQRA